MGEVTKLKSRFNEIGKRYLAGESSYDIARSINAHPSNIRNILISLNIPRRNRKEVSRLRARSVALSSELYSKINGWLLGDGSLAHSGVSSKFTLTSKHVEYVNFAKKIFENNNIKCKIYTNIDKVFKTEGHRCVTVSTLEFADLYYKWYPESKKIVPKDLTLTSSLIKNWIMDDGTISKEKGHLRLCTCSFTVDECERLSNKLNEFLNIDNASWVIEKKKYPRIYMPKRFTKLLLNKIGVCELNCFQYKWKHGIGDKCLD